MSKTHFSGDRKRQANNLADAFERLYKHCWGEDTQCHNYQDGVHYPRSMDDMTDAQLHDIIGADRLVLRETHMGILPTWVEEKSRLYRPWIDAPYQDSPFAVDLALTTEYHNKTNQPKHRKHVEYHDKQMFIPSVLAYLVADADDTPIRGYLIDYHKLLANKSEIAYQPRRNDSDGNTSHYISQMQLIEHGLVIDSWVNEDYEGAQ